jgi:hypothetical protein
LPIVIAKQFYADARRNAISFSSSAGRVVAAQRGCRRCDPISTTGC